MADREIIAAMPAAGMLPRINRSAEAASIDRAVALYKAVLARLEQDTQAGQNRDALLSLPPKED